MPDALCLRDYPAGDVVRVECAPCGRAGRYSLARLIEKHGPDMGLPDLLAVITADCPKRQDWRQAGPCRAGFPNFIAKSPQ